MKETAIKIANAPCSWGALEFELDGEVAGFDQVLSEMKQTGYAGCEFGDWGFMPTDPPELRKVLAGYDLELLGAFVPVALADKASHQRGVEKALKTAALIHSAGYRKAFIILADDNGAVEERTKSAGRISAEMGLSAPQWNTFAEGAQQVAAAVKESYNMRTVFHHHCGGYVETPEELDKLMAYTDPQLLGLCLDTGHYCFGGGDPLQALDKFYDRIWHLHFKDYDPVLGEESRLRRWDYFESIAQGVFCRLGKGSVDFKSITRELIKRKYDGWIVVEQDVLPGMGNPKSCAQDNREYLKRLGL